MTQAGEGKAEGESTMSKVKVAHFFKRMDIGGAEVRTIQLMEYLGQSVTPLFVVSSRQTGVLDDRVREIGGEVVRLPLGLFYGPRIWLLLRQRNIDVVHSHLALFSGVINFFAFSAGVSVRISHFRSDGNRNNASYLRRSLRRIERFFVDHFSTSVVGVSPGSLTYGYREDWTSRHNVQVIPNGLALTRQSEPQSHELPSASLRLLHIGRANPDKRREFLGQIVNALVTQGIDCVLTVVGELGEDTDRAVELVGAAGNRDSIRVVGILDNPMEILASSDLLLLPSRREGLPGVVLEALSVGTPVVASELPGVRYIAEHCEGVESIPVQATARDWAELISDFSRWRLPSEQIRSDFMDSPFSLAKVAPRFLGLYKATN